MTATVDARLNAMNRINAVLATLPPACVRTVIRALAVTHHILVTDITQEA